MVPNAPPGTSHRQLIEAEKGIGSVSLDGFSARDSPVRGQLGRKGPLAVSVEAAEKRRRGLGRPSSRPATAGALPVPAPRGPCAGPRRRHRAEGRPAKERAK